MLAQKDVCRLSFHLDVVDISGPKGPIGHDLYAVVFLAAGPAEHQGKGLSDPALTFLSTLWTGDLSRVI